MSCTQLVLALSGQRLAAMDRNGFSDPYFVVYLVSTSGQRSKLYRSETIKKNLNPEWKSHLLYVSNFESCFLQGK
jgi:Ca2+-dependent lipid-binding protein